LYWAILVKGRGRQERKGDGKAGEWRQGRRVIQGKGKGKREGKG
jgi:hypothetical protein